mmetsp:Transcript_14847/g.44749  ORF Transcript_14847/g.44749 Transcript_14847/m.44749 type:complete len:275 (+) Transcript_14847:494-1318(+)
MSSPSLGLGLGLGFGFGFRLGLQGFEAHLCHRVVCRRVGLVELHTDKIEDNAAINGDEVAVVIAPSVGEVVLVPGLRGVVIQTVTKFRRRHIHVRLRWREAHHIASLLRRHRHLSHEVQRFERQLRVGRIRIVVAFEVPVDAVEEPLAAAGLNVPCVENIKPLCAGPCGVRVRCVPTPDADAVEGRQALRLKLCLDLGHAIKGRTIHDLRRAVHGLEENTEPDQHIRSLLRGVVGTAGVAGVVARVGDDKVSRGQRREGHRRQQRQRCEAQHAR